jgi:hypothetical protein
MIETSKTNQTNQFHPARLAILAPCPTDQINEIDQTRSSLLFSVPDKPDRPESSPQPFSDISVLGQTTQNPEPRTQNS